MSDYEAKIDSYPKVELTAEERNKLMWIRHYAKTISEFELIAIIDRIASQNWPTSVLVAMRELSLAVRKQTLKEAKVICEEIEYRAADASNKQAASSACDCAMAIERLAGE
jgi:hypothetical protein